MENTSTESTTTEIKCSADSLRKIARRRAMWCSGAGLSHLGYSKAGAITLGISLLLVAVLWWFCLAPSAWAAWAVGMALLAAIFTLGVEFLAIWRLPVGENPPGVLSRKYRLVCVALYPMVLALLVTMGFRFAVVRVYGGGMEPTITENQLLIYHRKVEESRLGRGQVILWKPTEKSATVDSGSLLVGRILAIPGDTISLRGRFYVVNGQVASRMGTPGKYVPVLHIPYLPESMTVPKDCYFIVQDRPLSALDSRVLSWATREGMVSNSLYRLTLREFMGRLE